jgi:hypothetical protein
VSFPLRNDLAQAFHDLTDLALEDPKRSLADEDLGHCAAFRVECVGGFPQLLEHMQEIEDQGDVLEMAAHEPLQAAFSVGHDDPGLFALWIAPEHLRTHVRDEAALARQETGPHAFAPRLVEARFFRELSCAGANRRCTISSAVRGSGACVKTAATVDIRFFWRFSPLRCRTRLHAGSSFTMGMPLLSIAATRIGPSSS